MTWKKPGAFLKQAGFWVAAIAVGIFAKIFKEQLGISTGAWILFLGLIVYIQFELSKLKERIGLEELPTLDVIMETNAAKPIEPKHKRAEKLAESGYWTDDGARLFLGHFAAFADVANECLKDAPWRLQEEANTDVATVGDDGPIIGRRYILFHGSQWVGNVRLHDAYKYTLDTPIVFTSVTIFYPRRFLPSEIRELIGWLASLNCSGPVEEEQSAYNALRQAMIYAMWRNGPKVVTNTDLEVSLSGSAARYLIRAKIRPDYS